MARFESAKLDHEIQGNFVLFKLNVKMHFDAEGVGKPWLLQIEFWEKDPGKDDQLFPVPESVRVGELHGGQIRHYIQPSQQDIDWSDEIEFPSHLVDTEPGKEEVYSILKLRPVGENTGLQPDEITTNITDVDV